MTSGLTPQMKASIAFAWIGGSAFLLVAIYLTIRRRRLHPLLLVCIAAISISWIEAPYDWAVYAQFAPGIPRMPSWWPLDMTWGGLPASVPVGYISYFATPAIAGAALGRWLSSKFQWRLPTTLLCVGLVVGFVWAVFFNGFLGARTGIFYYGRVIPGLALRQGTKHQYPLYDALAMGVMVMVFAYLLGRTDADGRTVIERWAESKSPSRLLSNVLSVFGVIVIANLLYGAVFAPHLTAKLEGWETAGPTANLFPSVPNQPLYGTAHGRQQTLREFRTLARVEATTMRPQLNDRVRPANSAVSGRRGR
jgi:vacuolar-type H+-ATPase subunit I/STV1